MNILTLLFLVNFLRTIIVILIIYYGIRLFARYILPILVDKGVKNMQQKIYDQQKQQQRSSRHEGEVTIENQGKNPGKNQNTRGEYVDFEEVD